MVKSGMELIPIEVKCHSGYKGDEYPVSFCWNDEIHEIREIVDRWYQGERNPEWPVSNYFKVLTNHGGSYILKHVAREDQWYLCR